MSVTVEEDNTGVTDMVATTGLKKEFGVVRKTTDYNRFMYMGGNREVDLKHVKELQAQMERNRAMFASLPILVNDNWYIVDGQHRFEAAKGLGLPVYYIMQQGAGLSDARQLNIAQKRWGLKDFAQSYADSGRTDYVELLRINAAYPKIPLSIIIDYLAGVRGGGRTTDRFRRGEFQIIDKEDALAALDLLAEVMEIHGRPTNNAFSAALWKLVHIDEFDQYVFLRKLKENPDALHMATSTRASLRSIEEVYNRYNKVPVRLY